VVSTLVTRGLVFEYPGKQRALAGVELALERGELVCLVGPNGSGKSTLLRLCAGLLAPSAGTVELDGRTVHGLEARERARRLAFVPQALRALPDLDARSFVLGGRYAHQTLWSGILARETRADREAVERALTEADALDLASRRLDELSLGQFQRVRVARALAQEAPLFLFDEPTAALDPEHQVRLFLLIERLVAAGRTALVVTHELSLASRFAQRCLVLSEGRVAAEGAPAAVFRPEVLTSVFGAHLHYGLAGAGRPFVVPWPAGETSQ
jgi:iron complex transport system ATP-binding protein